MVEDCRWGECGKRVGLDHPDSPCLALDKEVEAGVASDAERSCCAASPFLHLLAGFGREDEAWDAVATLGGAVGLFTVGAVGFLLSFMGDE